MTRTCLELCAGCGGMSCGMRDAGFAHVLLVEREARCVDTLLRNGWGDAVRHADVSEVDFRPYAGAVDVVCGGVPCQPFSSAGKLQGKDDVRNLFDEAVRCVDEVRPKGFLFENVTGFMRARFAAYRTGVIAQLTALGYHVHVHKTYAVDFGVPQKRVRCMLVGVVNTAAPVVPPAPTVDAPVPLRAVLERLGPPTGDDGHAVHPTPPKIYRFHTPSTLDKPAKTLLAGTGGPGGGNGAVQLDDGTVRYLTVREMASVQGFESTYKVHPTWTVSIKQLGNAAPPPMVREWARALAQSLPA